MDHSVASRSLLFLLLPESGKHANVFRQNPTLLCGRILLGARSPHGIFPRILARKDYAHETHTFG